LLGEEGSGERVTEGWFAIMESSGSRKMSSWEGLFALDFVGSNFKEKVIEFFLMVSGSLFYHLVLRPVDYFRSRKKKKQNSKPNNKPV
jgi:hypothetical protein